MATRTIKPAQSIRTHGALLTIHPARVHIKRVKPTRIITTHIKPSRPPHNTP